MTAKASFDEARVERLWRETFGSPARARALGSEIDALFRMSPTDGSGEALLRVTAGDPGLPHFQAALLAHVEAFAAELPVPRVLRNGAGHLCSEWAAPDGHRHVAIAMTFLRGRPLASVPPGGAGRRRLLEQMARLDLALADFDHPAAGRDLLWDVSQADRTLPMVDSIPDAALRALAHGALSAWRAEVAPALGSLRRQVIHNDFNPSNILVDDGGAISGIIDFGDVVRAPLICELATALAYMEPHGGFSAMLSAAARIYGARIPLTDQERALLPGLVRARAAMVAAVAHWRSAHTPGNGTYLQRNVPVAARLLAAAA